MKSQVELESEWADLTEDDVDPYTTIDKQNAFLETIVVTHPQLVLRYASEVLAHAYSSKYNKGIAFSKGLQGYAYYMLSDFERALPMLHEALADLKGSSSPYIEQQLNGAIAMIHISLSNFNEAFEYGYKTRTLLQENGNPVQEAWTLHGFGTGYLEMGLLNQAMDYYQDSLHLFVQEGDENGEARARTGIGSVHQALGQIEEAYAYHEKSLELFRANNNKIGEARALNDLGCIFLHKGEHQRAIDLHQKSLQIRKAIGNVQSQSTSLMNLGHVALAEGQLDQAILFYTEALEIATAVKAKSRIYQLHQALASTYEKKKDLEQALYHYKLFNEIQHAVVNDTIALKVNSLHATFNINQAEKEAEITRLKNIELREKNEQLQSLLKELRAAQSKLIQSEKMASLGQLTAGIAHEIKNPLNFVNNFAAISEEIVEEIEAVFESKQGETVAHVLNEIKELLKDLRFNVTKIHEHGDRADRIIYSMLQHARGKKGNAQPININTLLTEYIKLAYHGMRAMNPNFSAQIEKNFAESIPEIQARPHDLGRVFLNIMNNAFYAMLEKKQRNTNGYVPMLTIATGIKGNRIVITIEDNGPGIPPEIEKQIFNPFFTTKPSGEGTGLGLSLSYEIINREHHGELYLSRSTESGSSFVIELPISH